MHYIKTAMLLAGMTALFMGAGMAIGGQQGMWIALVMAAVGNVAAWWFSDRMLLRMYRAEPVVSGRLHGLVAQLAAGANMPVPKLYLIRTPQPNAFATGRSPEHGAVAVTEGLIQMLQEREIAAVIAHELAHIKNRDSLIMTITATMAGALGYLANMLLFFGGNRERPAHPLLVVAVMVLAPIAAMLVQMAISRTREYAADRLGAEICGDPMALASALEKIDSHARGVDNHVAEANPATAHMFIINPLHMRKSDGLFTTHPATPNRIAALRQMAETTTAPRRYYFDLSPEEKREGPWGVRVVKEEEVFGDAKPRKRRAPWV